MNHPVAGVPFHPKDVEHIRDCCILKDVMILNLRCSHVEIVDRMPKHVRHLNAELASYLRLQDGVHLQPAECENVKLSFDTFSSFSGFLERIDGFIKPAEKYMSRYTAMSIALAAIRKAGVLPEFLDAYTLVYISTQLIVATGVGDHLDNINNLQPQVVLLDGEPEHIPFNEEPEFLLQRRKNMPCEQMFSRLLSTFSSLFSLVPTRPAFEDNENSILLLPPEPDEDNVRYRGFRRHDADE